MFPYENLEVYKKAFLINKIIYNFIKNNTSVPHYLKNQLGRASLSIVLNIAEGSAKSTPRDRRSFMITARASAFECSSIIEILYSEKELSEEQQQQLYSGYEEVSKMLYAMIKNLEK